jgi:CRISPR-associated protein Cas5d
MKPNLITLRVWGDFACFTRPEMKVERVSYPVMTPSAARGILEAVFWEPQMFYLIDTIRVVKRGRWVSFRRNEVTKVISLDSAKTWMNAPEKTMPIQAGGGADDGTQRNMLALQDVEYLITAEVRVTPLANRSEDKLEKYLDEIERRARSGKCFHRPGLGMREFAADFEWESDADAAYARRTTELGRIAELFNEDVGLMLYDVFDHRERAEGFRWLSDSEISNSQSQTPVVAGRRSKKQATEAPRWSRAPIKPTPAFFHAKVERSRMDCHPDHIRILTSTKGGT